MARPALVRHGAAVATVGLLPLSACAGLSGSSPTPALSAPAPKPTAAPASSSGSLPGAPSPAPTSGTSTPSATPTSSASAGGPSSCAALVARLSVSAQVGQLLMVAVSSTRLSAVNVDAVADVHAGSVILLGNSTMGVAGTNRLVKRVREAADPPRGVDTMIAADQEGGSVQRLQGRGFAAIPSARVQATWSQQKLAAQSRDWGKQLTKAGIDANLAPVADVVPAAMTEVNQPIGRLRRGYGSTPKTVARQAAAFNRGMGAAGLATAAKHFPGLGRVRGNTDFSTDVVDSVTSRHDPGLAGFEALVDARVDMVMVSSATYARIDRRHRAVFSTTVITEMIRGDLGFDGVVISDDLSAAALADVTPGDRAVRFVEAGGDLAIVGDPGEARTIASALERRARKDKEFSRRLAESAGRVVGMKARRNRAACSPG